ncbi:hypothetical protein MUK42_18582 [Musa troglodytarum]|uniref:Probable magnesium transporter n=1 Tax=Musa troglodytarum TaxID=320322 RepID=A0A9E7ETF8_9LILI|nr:hypothetical protein MUK42_18582 [Musa troglodytarum]
MDMFRWDGLYSTCYFRRAVLSRSPVRLPNLLRFTSIHILFCPLHRGLRSLSEARGLVDERPDVARTMDQDLTNGGPPPAAGSPHLFADNVNGFLLAVASSALIGAGFIVKKQGLRRPGASAFVPVSGYGSLLKPLWWIGMVTMIFVEIANFVAYIFGPTVLAEKCWMQCRFGPYHPERLQKMGVRLGPTRIPSRTVLCGGRLISPVSVDTEIYRAIMKFRVTATTWYRLAVTAGTIRSCTNGIFGEIYT